MQWIKNIFIYIVHILHISKGMCPEFNSRVGKIDVFKCQSDGNNCPSTIFWSNAVYICTYIYIFKNTLFFQTANCQTHMIMTALSNATK